jgi:phytanoyl-CoA hydroxylase
MSILSVEQINFFDVNGYLVLKNLIEPERLESLREAVLRVIKGVDDGLRSRTVVTRKNGLLTMQLQQLHLANPLIGDFIFHPKLGAVASALMKDTPEVRLWHDQVVYKPPRVGGQVAFHQDYFYWQHLSAPDMVSAWCALSKSDEKSGCMFVVPGSHRWGLVKNRYRHEDAELEYIFDSCADHHPEKVAIVLEPGDVSFHHALTIHGSYQNESDQHRLGFVLHYLPSHVRYVEKFDVLKQDDINVGDGELIRGENFKFVWPRQSS